MTTTPSDRRSKVAVIAGAGPAGLTAALELLRRSDIIPMVFEADTQVGGISKTVNYRGNRMDLGGHRFFSKSDWVMRWWQEILPWPWAVGSRRAVARHLPARDSRLDSQCTWASRFRRRHAGSAAPISHFLSSAILRLSPEAQRQYTLKNMGAMEILRIGLSYGRARLKFRPREDTLEEFFTTRFGDRLYRTFFKDYTEKVWGVPCEEISAEWGVQRIKGLSITKAIAHAVANSLRTSAASDTSQKRTETSLIERFLYPKFGPGQMWEEVARQVTRAGARFTFGIDSWG